MSVRAAMEHAQEAALEAISMIDCYYVFQGRLDSPSMNRCAECSSDIEIGTLLR